MGKGQFIAAIVIFFVWLIHTSPWMYLGAGPAFLQEPLPEAIGIVEHTHYFYLERALWSTLLAGLAIALAGEGYLRWSRGRAGY